MSKAEIAALNQANYNLDFYNCICTNYPNRFTDWKITVLFYSSLQYTKSFLLNYGFSEDKVDSHEKTLDILRYPQNGKNVVNNDFYIAYRDFYRLSKSVRYNGLNNISTFEKDLLADLANAIKYSQYTRKYLTRRGIDCGIELTTKKEEVEAAKKK
jgi:hypothetical protein